MTDLLIGRALIAGGGAPEIELSVRLLEHSQTLTGMEQYCFRAFAEALNVIPFTLAENAGLNPIATVTELRNRHAQGEKTFGINVRKVRLSEEDTYCDGEKIRAMGDKFTLLTPKYL